MIIYNIMHIINMYIQIKHYPNKSWVNLLKRERRLSKIKSINGDKDIIYIMIKNVIHKKAIIILNLNFQKYRKGKMDRII